MLTYSWRYAKQTFLILTILLMLIGLMGFTPTPAQAGHRAAAPFAEGVRPTHPQRAASVRKDVASANPFTISGNAGVAGATLNYTDGSARTATSAADGSYSLTVSNNWSGSITPSDPGYTFSPTGLTYNNVLADQTGQDYTATAVASFADVPTTYWDWSWIERLFAAGITGGCGSGNYCPSSSVTRGQMAIFLERGMRGSIYTPPDASGTVFGDVPISYWSAGWIEKLYADGITGGCGSGNYCPDSAVTRAQMAIFLLRGEHGSSYTPPAATGTVFGDVPTSYWAAAWIEQLYTEGITGGCSASPLLYCPNSPVTRAQMAIFLMRTFSLPTIIPVTTEILGDTSSQDLASVSTDGSVYSFSATTPELQNLNVGDIMIGGVSPAAPDGFLRQVTSISSSGGQVNVTTNDATIEQAFQQVSLQIDHTLTPADIQNARSLNGLHPQAVYGPQGVSLDVPIDNVVLYDADGNLATTNDQVVANGDITLSPTIHLTLNIQNFHIQNLTFSITGQETASLTISSEAELSAKAEYDFPPILLGAIPTPIGPIVPGLTFSVGVDGSLHVGVSTGVTDTMTLTGGVSYAQGQWSNIASANNSFTYTPPVLSTGLDAKGFVGAKLSLMVDGVAGPNAEIEAYLRLEADPLAVPWWTLYGGLSVNAGVEIDVFSVFVLSYQADLIEYEKVITQAKIPPPTVDVRVNGSDGPVNLTDQDTFTVSWTSTNADSCTGSGSMAGQSGLNGNYTDGPKAGGNYTYTMTCNNGSGYASDSVVVNLATSMSKTINSDLGDGEVLNRWCSSDWNTCRNVLTGNANWQGLTVGTIGATFDSQGYTIQRIFFYFDTGAIPTNAQITSATLNIYAGQYQNGNKTVDLVRSTAAIPLSTSDFSKIEYVSGGSVTPPSPNTWISINLNATALNWIIKGGMTKLALIHDLDLNNIVPTVANDILIGLAEDQQHCPNLVVNYSYSP